VVVETKESEHLMALSSAKSMRKSVRIEPGRKAQKRMQSFVVLMMAALAKIIILARIK
jgi:hypothetical protein